MGIPEYSAPSKRGCGPGCIAAGIIAGVLVVIALWLFGAYQGAYNRLVVQDEAVKKAWSDVEVQLSRRSDLIPNLVRTVKGAAGHEEKVFGDIANARARLAGTGSGPSPERINASNEVSSALNRLLVIAEAYPNLKANENFLTLQDQIEGTENRLKHSREQYNRAVQEYNRTARSFPMNMFIHLTPFKPEQPYFEAPAASREAPVVNFDKPEPAGAPQ
jgi:LemA protein